MADEENFKNISKSIPSLVLWSFDLFLSEYMQTFGYLTSMLPIVEEMYDTKKNKRMLYSSLSLHNTEYNLVSCGITAGFGEARANGDAVDGGNHQRYACRSDGTNRWYW